MCVRVCGCVCVWQYSAADFCASPMVLPFPSSPHSPGPAQTATLRCSRARTSSSRVSSCARWRKNGGSRTACPPKSWYVAVMHHPRVQPTTHAKCNVCPHVEVLQHQTRQLPARFVHTHDGHMFAFKLGAIKISEISRRLLRRAALRLWKVRLGVCARRLMSAWLWLWLCGCVAVAECVCVCVCVVGWFHRDIVCGVCCAAEQNRDHAGGGVRWVRLPGAT